MDKTASQRLADAKDQLTALLGLLGEVTHDMAEALGTDPQLKPLAAKAAKRTRSHLEPLVRRGRNILRKIESIEVGDDRAGAGRRKSKRPRPRRGGQQ